MNNAERLTEWSRLRPILLAFDGTLAMPVSDTGTDAGSDPTADTPRVIEMADHDGRPILRLFRLLNRLDEKYEVTDGETN